MRAVLAILTALFLNPSPTTAFQNGQYVGKSKSFLLQCAGVPQSAISSEGVEYFTYSASRSRGGVMTLHQSTPQTGTATIGSFTDTCQITFAISKGRIINSSARSSGGIFTGPMMCNSIVQNCN